MPHLVRSVHRGHCVCWIADVSPVISKLASRDRIKTSQYDGFDSYQRPKLSEPALGTLRLQQ